MGDPKAEKQEKNGIPNKICVHPNMHSTRWTHLIHFSIVVIIMAYTINTLDIIPNGTTKFRCIHILDAGHSEIGQIVGTPEFLIQQSANIFIESATESMQTNIIAASMQATPKLTHWPRNNHDRPRNSLECEMYWEYFQRRDVQNPDM